MKQSFFAGLLTLAFASISFAGTPYVVGDVTFKDELIILNKNIVCKAYSVPADNVKAETIVNGEFTMAIVKGNDITVEGYLDGDLFTIRGTIGEAMDISLQQRGTAPGKAPSYSFSTSGLFTNLIVHGEEVKNVSLMVRLDGQHKSVSCSQFKNK